MKTKRVDLIDSLTERGYRLTPQRELLLSLLGGTDKHLSAETLLARVRKVYPRVNKSVVYRNLELLTELGLVSCVNFGSGRVEYEVHRHPHHHHLVCRNCHHMIEINSDTFAALQQQLTDRYGFIADMDHFALFGLCRNCQSKSPAQHSHHPHPL
jgi:Fur family ferric uptake transcriptional regulator